MQRASDWRFGIGLAITMTAVVWLGSVAAQQAPPAATPAPAPAGQTANVTGRGGFIDSADLQVRRIRLEAGARTYWHVHTATQVIIAEEGEGLCQEQGGPVRRFKPGEPVLLHANVPHWHGAAANSFVVQATMYSGTIKWLEPVTDTEYAGKKKR